MHICIHKCMHMYTNEFIHPLAIKSPPPQLNLLSFCFLIFFSFAFPVFFLYLSLSSICICTYVYTSVCICGHGGRHYPPLPQAMSIKIKGVLRVGVPSMQDLQEWAKQLQSSEDYQQLTLETFEAAPQWLAENRVNVKWKPLSVSSDMERKIVCEYGR